ncbi:MAG: class A beta-lactamase-related serine hydrolase [Sphingobacteriales bacterium]|nr:MAG: class A beta-lactamase-related serine hydrolase [Sphingobacteriales bacterium]
MKKTLLFLYLFILCCASSYAQTLQSHLQQVVDSFYKIIPGTSAIMVHVESPYKKVSWSYAIGYSDKNAKTPVKAGQPALLASNTKTYVAASILKLAEKKKFNIDDPIENLISVQSKEWLKGDGYDLQAIKVRNLMSHTSGINDYTEGDYFDFVNTHRKYKWTRDEQIKRTVEITDPLGAPGDTFKYADVNYLLLTEIIERFTRKPFYESIRELVDYKKLGLKSTWFVDLEKKPKGVKELVHQYWSKYPWDSYDLDPSWDLYGGGGMASNTKDLAIFFQRLFEGKIVHDKALIEAMHTYVMPKEKSNYCLGIRNINIAGLTGYYHGGFWGTDVSYFPDINSTVCIFILQRDERDKGGAICKELVNVLK